MAKKKLQKTEYKCPFELALDLVNGKWKGLVLWYLFDETRRYGEIKKAYPKITQKMLSQTLKDLEKNKLITRKVYAQIPPKVEYSITKEGKELYPIFEMLYKWGEKMSQTLDVEVEEHALICEE